MKSSMEMRSATRLDAAIEFACQTAGKSRRNLMPQDFQLACQRAVRTNQPALVQPLEMLSSFDELVDAMRESNMGPPQNDIR